MEKPLRIEFDPAKDATNIAKHGISLAEAARIEFATVMVTIDDRADYGELREVLFGFIGSRLHTFVFTMRGPVCRAISLRKSNRKEIRTYVEESE